MPNIYNLEAIPQYLAEMAGEDKELGRYLTICLEKALRKDGYWVEPVPALPEDAPDFMRKQWAAAPSEQYDKWHAFRPSPNLNLHVRHVADWIKAAMVTNEEWLKDVDEKGQPKTLVQVGTLQAALNKANKAMEAARQKAKMLASEEDGINVRHEMSLGNGFRIVRLLTPKALDDENTMVGHCIGGGAYDSYVQGARFAYYSLRDKNGKAHATFEVELIDNVLRQCQGKENNPPVPKYMPYVKAFVERRGFELKASASHTGLVKLGGRYYDMTTLSEGLRAEGLRVKSLNLSYCTSLTTLPEGLRAETLKLSDCTALTALPKGLRVRTLYLRGCTALTALPEGLRVKTLDLSGCTALTALPEGLRVKTLDLSDCTALTALPKGLQTESLDLSDCTALTTLPEGLRVKYLGLYGCTGLTALPKGLQAEYLYLYGCTGLTALPEGLRAEHLNLSGCTSLTTLSEGLRVESLNLSGCTSLTALPKGLRAESITLPNGGYYEDVSAASAAFAREIQGRKILGDLRVGQVGDTLRGAGMEVTPMPYPDEHPSYGSHIWHGLQSKLSGLTNKFTKPGRGG